LRAGLAQGELLVADLDAGIPDPPNQGAGVVDLCLQPRDAGAQRVRGGGALVAGVARGVTPGAGAAGPGGQHLVRRGGHGVIAVALDAPLVEDRLVDAGRELLREHGVTRAAHVGHGADSRRRGTVIAVAVVARRRRQIVAFRQRGVVNALAVVRVLTGWQR